LHKHKGKEQNDIDFHSFYLLSTTFFCKSAQFEQILLALASQNIKMRKIYLLSLIVASSISITSCTKDDNGGGGNGGGNTSNTDTLFISLSKDTVELNNFDFVTITVTDSLGNDITSTCNIILNNSLIISSKYLPTQLGNNNISAEKGNRPSKVKDLFVTSPNPSPFSQKVLVEDLTGTWCGYCTRVAYSLSNYKATHPNLISTTIHGGSNSDPFQFKYYNTFNSTLGISGYPSVIINRKTEWNESLSTLNTALAKWSPLGLAISSTESGGTITGTVKVKFNVTTDRAMKIVIMLVENDLVYPQTNYYSTIYGETPYLYGGVSPVTNFVHNGVLRKTATNLFGDAIPVSQQVKDNEYIIPFTMTLSGSTYSGSTYNAISANSAIVATVVDASTQNIGSFNSQYAAVGVIQDYN